VHDLRSFPRLGAAFAACALGALAPLSIAHAWGATGHRMIGQLGVSTLPDSLPAFLKTPEAMEAVGELAREPDRWRGAGKAHDNMRDPGHFVDVDDSGKVLGGPDLAALPATRTDYETALRAVGTESGHAGYLPYSIIDGWQQLAKDFAYWRVETAAIPHQSDSGRKAWMEADLKRREALIIRDLGVWSHFVGDASQPMHVSVHYDGWGKYPNPDGYTEDRVHVPYEGAFVRRFVSEDAARAAMPPLRPCPEIQACTERYLAETWASVIPFYQMQKAGGLTGSDPSGRDFTVRRIAAGAAALRDLIVAAWEASAHESVGYPQVTVDQVVRDGIDPFDALYGED
jgi:hypothetical protein